MDFNPTTQQNEVPKLLQEHTPLLINRVNSWHDTTGVGQDELWHEAHTAFACAVRSFDATKGSKFSTYLYRCVENQMAYAVKKWNKVAAPMIVQDADGNEVNPADLQPAPQDREWMLRDEVDSLSDDAKTVVELLLDTPAELATILSENSNAPKLQRGSLKRYLQEQHGWSLTKVWDTFREIDFWVRTKPPTMAV